MQTPLAFRYIRIILLTAEARRAQDIHLDQHSGRVLSVCFATQLGVSSRWVIRGAVAQSIVYYLAFYDLLVAGKGMPGAVRDYTLSIKVPSLFCFFIFFFSSRNTHTRAHTHTHTRNQQVRSHDFLAGTHNVYRVNCIRTNHDLGFYHIVMRTLQN